MGKTRVVRRLPKAAGAVHNGETRVVRRRLMAAGAVYNGGNASGAEAAEGRRSCSQWGNVEWCGGGRRPPELFTMGQGVVYNGIGC